MSCSCTKRRQMEYVWISDDGTEVLTYSTEIQAKARVIRAGGTYTPREK